MPKHKATSLRKTSTRGTQKGLLASKPLWRRFAFAFAMAVAAGIAFLAFSLVLMRWVNPPFTAVQLSRSFSATLAGTPYQRRYSPVPLRRIAPDLQHAVVAAEDARFYGHKGIDFQELQKVIGEEREDGRVGRGASTITQQLVKNLFLTTRRSYLRKALEFVLAPAAEVILPKQRILELYLNVIEWGPGVYGAEAAARYHYGSSAASLSRDQAARMAAILPAPLRRKPARMEGTSLQIQSRMRQMGW